MINIRPVNNEDHSFILGLATRFLKFKQLDWRDSEKMLAAQIRLAEEAISGKPEGSELFVAEDQDKNLLGYLLMGVVPDFFTKEPKGFIYSIAVDEHVEGKGVGRALLHFAEEWARKKGCKLLALNVFAENQRAYSFYEKSGFITETCTMVKPLKR
ncbi:GNAT family N-acetyltransferase [Thermoflavimicrobium daqui]|uniref:N-acetyltransferase n=1 Tax=Thermoflavimicrobium daqui TaxID=2137476 RepID=A0A364K205_9BACL|nr:GNAT family N-acetyltransferase [Thermoflavimicrobium daqui]RAL22068.1 N-acetyltransferase [Thermoflavimicrobium daqui]